MNEHASIKDLLFNLIFGLLVLNLIFAVVIHNVCIYLDYLRNAERPLHISTQLTGTDKERR